MVQAAYSNWIEIQALAQDHDSATDLTASQRSGIHVIAVKAVAYAPVQEIVL